MDYLILIPVLKIFPAYMRTGVSGKRPERPLEVLTESGDCSTSAQDWAEVRIVNVWNFYPTVGRSW